MGAMERLTVEVPVELAESLRSRVVSGEFANLEDVLREALLDFEADAATRDTGYDAALHVWARRELIPTVEANRRDPSRLLTIEQVRANLEAARAARLRSA